MDNLSYSTLSEIVRMAGNANVSAFLDYVSEGPAGNGVEGVVLTDGQAISEWYIAARLGDAELQLSVRGVGSCVVERSQIREYLDIQYLEPDVA